MAVFTPVSEKDAQTLLTQYNLGNMLSLQGISAGIENTNYFLDTTKGRYVLTVFEVLTHQQLPFYIELMHHLAQHGVPVPEPQTRRNGERLSTLHHKPCAIVTRLRGRHETQPGVAHCRLAGATLAQAHLAARDFKLAQPNLRSLPWWQEVTPKILPFLSAQQAALIQSELAVQSEFFASAAYQALPSGPAHCDLFRDNVLFDGDHEHPSMGGFIDFYFAGCDTWLFDVAVAVNDWCIDRADGQLQEDLLQAWLLSYASVRPFSDAEKQAWPLMLRAAALRFWTSRLYDFHRPRDAETLQPHDPSHFERVLQTRIQQGAPALP